MSNPFQNIGKNALYLCIALTASVVIAKTVIRGEKVSKFNPQTVGEEPATDKDKYYSNLAQVQPGFPLKKQKEEIHRKSEFEGAGLSYVTRKRGDKLGFLDRRSEE